MKYLKKVIPFITMLFLLTLLTACGRETPKEQREDANNIINSLSPKNLSFIKLMVNSNNPKDGEGIKLFSKDSKVLWVYENPDNNSFVFKRTFNGEEKKVYIVRQDTSYSKNSPFLTDDDFANPTTNKAYQFYSVEGNHKALGFVSHKPTEVKQDQSVSYSLLQLDKLIGSDWQSLSTREWHPGLGYGTKAKKLIQREKIETKKIEKARKKAMKAAKAASMKAASESSAEQEERDAASESSTAAASESSRQGSIKGESIRNSESIRQQQETDAALQSSRDYDAQESSIQQQQDESSAAEASSESAEAASEESFWKANADVPTDY